MRSRPCLFERYRRAMVFLACACSVAAITWLAIRRESRYIELEAEPSEDANAIRTFITVDSEVRTTVASPGLVNDTAASSQIAGAIDDLSQGDESYFGLEGPHNYINSQENMKIPDFHFYIPPRYKYCEKPLTRVIYLKIHEAGGDVLSNILGRLAERYGAKLALPQSGKFTFDWPKRFNWQLVDIWTLNGSLPDIICHQGRYDEAGLDKVIHDDAVFVTLIRDPVEHFLAIFEKYEFRRLFNIDNATVLEAATEFLKRPQEYLMNAASRGGFMPLMNLARNPTMFDLGFRTDHYHVKVLIESASRGFQDKFKMVLIAGYLDESLVLLRRRMCWSEHDILYLDELLDQGIQLEKMMDLQQRQLLTDLLNRWSSADVFFYRLLKDAFLKDVAREIDFREEVERFRNSKKRVQAACVERARNFSPSSNVTTLLPDGVSCDKLAMRDAEYIQQRRKSK